MELTSSFVDLPQHFVPVFTTPTFQTFLQIVAGWVVSQRHRYLTEVIFAGGNVGNGHWCQFHRFSSWWPSGSLTPRSSSAVTALTAARAFSRTCPPTFISSATFIPKARFTNQPQSRRRAARERLERKVPASLAWPSD